MTSEEPERCPEHPSLEPIRSSWTDLLEATRRISPRPIQEWRRPACCWRGCVVLASCLLVVNRLRDSRYRFVNRW